MNPITVQAVASVFSFAAAAIGIPSLAVLLLYVINAIHRYLSAPTTATRFGENPDALLMMLKGMTETMGAISRFVGALSTFVLEVLAVVAGVGLILAIVLWFTGKGLQASANWARVSAMIVLLLALLPSLLMALSMHYLPRLIMLGVVVFCALSIHTLYSHPFR